MAAIDPVCGMTIEEDQAASTAEFEGTTYYFCAMACKHEFVRHPEKYAEKREEEEE